MQISNQMIWSLLAVVFGVMIGVSFGLIQQAAYRRNQKLQESGKLNNGWAVMPGSGKRVAYLLVALALIQVICPMLFKNGIQWWVSGGVVAGYGYTLYTQLRQKLGHR